jgi:hypothetical protein
MPEESLGTVNNVPANNLLIVKPPPERSSLTYNFATAYDNAFSIFQFTNLAIYQLSVPTKLFLFFNSVTAVDMFLSAAICVCFRR